MDVIEGKTAVVTGGGNGIGRSIALALAERGANVVVADIRHGHAEEVADEVRRKGVKAVAVHTDVSDQASVASLADRAFGEFGSVEILCNNAGVNWRPFRTVLEASLQDWAFILNINLWGVVYGLDAFLPRMDAQAGEKHIVNTASQAGLLPLGGMAPYCASKAAVVFLSEAAARELAPRGFGMTILCPGTVTTEVGRNGELLRPEAERGPNRQFSTLFQDANHQRMVADPIPPDVVGEQVCEAIRNGTLYLHTHSVPAGLPEERMRIMFGS